MLRRGWPGAIAQHWGPHPANPHGGQGWGKWASHGRHGGVWEKGPEQGQEHPRSPPYPESPGGKWDSSSLAPGQSPGPAEGVALTTQEGGPMPGITCLRPPDQPPGREAGRSPGSHSERVAGLQAGTWAQVRRGQCWVQTLLPPRQRQLSQASCHSAPGWGEWGTSSSPSPSLGLWTFLYHYPILSPARGLARAKDWDWTLQQEFQGSWALGAQRVSPCWGATCCSRPQNRDRRGPG